MDHRNTASFSLPPANRRILLIHFAFPPPPSLTPRDLLPTHFNIYKTGLINT